MAPVKITHDQYFIKSLFYFPGSCPILLPLAIFRIFILMHTFSSQQKLSNYNMSPLVSGNAAIWDDSYLPPINGQPTGPPKSTVYYR